MENSPLLCIFAKAKPRRKHPVLRKNVRNFPKHIPPAIALQQLLRRRRLAKKVADHASLARRRTSRYFLLGGTGNVLATVSLSFSRKPGWFLQNFVFVKKQRSSNFAMAGKIASGTVDEMFPVSTQDKGKQM